MPAVKDASEPGRSRPASGEATDSEITQLLRAAASGGRQAVDALMAAIYGDLRRLAASHMEAERGDHTLQPTALVHEAYVRLIDQRSTGWRDRLHFFAVASRIIRRILIDHARSHNAQKRGGGHTGGRRARVSLSEASIGGTEDSQVPEPQVPGIDLDIVALDEAMEALAALDPQQARIVELRYFGGCSIEEVAELLSMSARTVDRQWKVAKAWLFERLRETDEEPGPRTTDGEHATTSRDHGQ